MARAMDRVCRQCGWPLSKTARRCESCGAAIPRAEPEAKDAPRAAPTTPEAGTCAVCGSQLEPAATVCRTCGHPPGAKGRATKPLSSEEERLLGELEWAMTAQGNPPPPPLVGEVPPGAHAERQELLDFLLSIPGVRRRAAVAISAFFLNLEHVGLSETADIAAIPVVEPGEARLVKEAVDRFLAQSTNLPPPPPPPATPEREPPPLAEDSERPPSEPPPSVADRPTREPPSRLAALREIAAIGTLLALPVAAGAAVSNAAGHEWAQLLLFGVLFGIGVGLTLPDLDAVPRARAAMLLHGSGTAILLATPLLGFAGGIPPLAADVALLGVGTGLSVLGAWRLRNAVGMFIPWLSGLLLLTVLAAAPLAFAAPGATEVGAARWAVGGAFALAPAILVAVRRWLRYAADARLIRGDGEFARRDYSKAIGSYEAAIALGRRANHETSAAWYGKGAALVALGQTGEGIAALDHALALNPEDEVAWINKGTALTRLGRMNDALRCFNAAIKVNAAYEVAWNNKGNALARLGKHEGALACYERALEIDPAYRTAWVNKGFLLAKLGRFDDAAQCADAALRLGAQDAARG